MKRIFLLSILLSAATALLAQTSTHRLTLKPYLGVVISSSEAEIAYIKEGMTSLAKSKSKGGLTLGLEAKCHFRPDMSASIAVEYLRAGWNYQDFMDFSEKTKTGDFHTNTNVDNHYIALPLKWHYHFGKGFSAQAGLHLSYLISSKMHYDYTEFKEFEDRPTQFEKIQEVSFDIKNKMKKTHLAIPVGIAYTYQNVNLEANYYFPITKVSKDDLFGTRMKMVSITVGYNFDLK